MLRNCLKDVCVFLVKTEETSKNSTWNSFSAWCPPKCDTYLYKPANLFKNALASRGPFLRKKNFLNMQIFHFEVKIICKSEGTGLKGKLLLNVFLAKINLSLLCDK